MDSHSRTVVLVGKSGTGKSATGNSIVGSDVFEINPGGVTRTCQLSQSDDQIFTVIDTPGLFDFSDAKELEGEITRCVELVKNGIHAVLVVLSALSRYSREDEAVLLSLQKFFGENICEYMIVVFTGGDELEFQKNTLDQFVASKDSPVPLKEMLKRYGNRMILFDNRTTVERKKAEQRSRLLSLVDNVFESNNGEAFTNTLFKSLQVAAELREQIAKSHDEQEKDQLLKEAQEQMKKYHIMFGSRFEEMFKTPKEQLGEERDARRRAEERDDRRRAEERDDRRRLEPCAIM